MVLVRKVNNTEEDEWSEDEYEDDLDSDEADEASDDGAPSSIDLTEELKQSLAAKASEVGVMQAAPGTEQGQSGWYVDVSSEVQYWNVGEDGSWTRVD